MNKIFSMVFFLVIGQSITAQQISGKVNSIDNLPLPGAHVDLTPPRRSFAKTTISDDQGVFLFSNIPTGAYTLKITYLGFKEYTQIFYYKGDTLQLDPIQLLETSTELEEVIVKEKAIIATQEGDTTSYYADAYQTLADANAEDLIKKMPGVVIQNGKVQADGENVKEVLVDGRPFFGKDPNVALKNLPAAIIDKVQVFDRASEQDEFTGFNSGETSKSMNIVTKIDMRTGQFGKANAGYGTAARYNAGGNFSIFNGDQRTSIFGSSDNVNGQMFASPGGSPSGNRTSNEQGDGITEIHAVGLNYSDHWGEKVSVNGSYQANNMQNEFIKNLRQQYFDKEETNSVYTEDNNNTNQNTNHIFNCELAIGLDARNSILISPQFTLQQTNLDVSTIGQTDLEETILNRSNNGFRGDLSDISFGNNFLYQHQFKKLGRTISLNLNTNYNEALRAFFLESKHSFLTTMVSDLDSLDQYSTEDNGAWSIASDLSYTESMANDKGQIKLSYLSHFNRNQTNKQTFDFDESVEKYDQLNTELTNFFKNKYTTHEARIAYNHKFGKLSVLTHIGFQKAYLKNDEIYPVVDQAIQVFNNVLPYTLLKYAMSKSARFSLMYRTSNAAPSIRQLQKVIDNSNPLQLFIGNPELEQTFTHNFVARFRKVNKKKSSVLSARLVTSFSNNKIVNSNYLAEVNDPVFTDYKIIPGSQITRPVNLKGYLNMRSYVSLGIPVYKIKSKLNISLTGNLINTPSLIDQVENIIKRKALGLGVVLTSNISDQVDFTISSRSRFSNAKNTLESGLSNNYQTQSSNAKLAWIFGKGFVYRMKLQHQFYHSAEADFREAFLLWNMSIGKKLFKNQRGELALSVFDLLNQNRSISRTVTETYVEDSFSNILQRYVMLNFTYNFRHFDIGKKVSAE